MELAEPQGYNEEKIGEIKSNYEKIKEIVERINSIVFDSDENWVYDIP